MPVANTSVSNLEAARDNLTQVILAQTTAWAADGCPPTFSIDGESWNWAEWLKTKNEEILALNKSIQAISNAGPWIGRSRGRA